MKRNQYIDWLVTVLGIFATAYGAYLLIWHLNHGNGFKPAALVLLIIGIISLSFSIVLLTSRYFASKRRKENIIQTHVEEVIDEEKKEEVAKEEKPKEVVEEKITIQPRTEYVDRSDRISYSRPSISTAYVKRVGYGPLLRVEGNRILDMRDSTYYRIENNMVNQEGHGPRYEIRGNSIKDAFGGYLFELSGNNINKTYGGFYASISGSYITLYDGSIKYEMTDSLSNKQILAVVAILFAR